MKSHHLISIFLVPMLVAGCAAVRPVSDAALGAGGGLIANQLSHGNPGITAAGAAGGVLLSEGAFYLSGKQTDKAYVTGYEKGRSDAVKQQYWLYVSMQQAKAGDDGRVRLYEVHLPEQVIDGVIFQPTTQFIRIEE
jgi:hypothetical protein